LPLAPLFIFAGAPEKDPPKPGDPNVLYFGPGVHVIGVKEIPSDTTVYIAGGAVVRGHLRCAFARNVRVLGRGILDAGLSPRKHDPAKKNEFGEYRVTAGVYWSKDVLFEGIHLIDSPAWSLQIMHSEDVTARDLKVITWRENGDGIDVCTSERVRVEDCFLRCWDDALVVKAHLADPEKKRNKSVLSKWTTEDLAVYKPFAVRDVIFSGCVVWLDRAHALEIGLETAATEIAGITWKDIDIIHDCHIAAIDISVGDRARVHGLRYENIRIEDPRSSNLLRLYVGPCYTSIDNKMGIDYGSIEDVVFENVEVFGPKIPPSTFDARSLDKSATAPKIDGIVFKNLRFNGKPVLDARAAGLRPGKLVGRVAFEP